MTTSPAPLITAEEFGRMPDPADGSIDELVAGRVVIVGPRPKAVHGIVCSNVGSLLGTFVEGKRLGWVVARSGVILKRNPDTVRGPDISYYSFTRLPVTPDDYFEIAPDLVVEVLSSDDRRGRVRDKIREYIAAGVRLVWLVDPETRTVLEYRGTEYDAADTLSGADVLPEFTCRVADLFG